MLTVHYFEPNAIKKIVLIGDAGVGKSSIREVFFDYMSSEKIINESLEPTRGYEYHEYDLYDLRCSVLDTSGQELYSWLNDQSEEIFSGADIVIYVVDSSEFTQNIDEIYDYLKKISITARIYSPNTLIALFAHKTDLIDDSRLEQFKKQMSREHKVFQIAEEVDIPIFFTSILEKHIRTLNIAFIKLFKIDSLILPNYSRFLNDV
jgi:small GTP-binding protein